MVVGGFWGDEGKGRIIAYLAEHDNPRLVARAGVGTNAGHSIVFQGEVVGVRQIPCGLVNPTARLLIGAGVLVDPMIVLEEIRRFGVGDRLGIDERCAIIEESHKLVDKTDEHLKKYIGTTGSGSGPAQVARVSRKACLARDVPELKRYLADVPLELNEALDRGEEVLIEGTQGFGLSLLYGTYPFVTSKDTTASTFAADVGLGPGRIDEVVITFKTFTTRVGEGPFPTEISQEEAEARGIVEYGVVTGRRRRIGLFDFELAKRAVMINNATQVALTGIDRIDPGSRGKTRCEELGEEAKRFVEKVEDVVDVPVTFVSTSPEPGHIIDMRAEKL